MRGLRSEEEILLLAAATANRRAAEQERARRLSLALDWSGLTERLHVQRLLPTLGPRILELAGERASPSFESTVGESISSVCRQDALLQLIGARVVKALAEAGIRASALKGPLLGEAVYGEPGRRESRDIDLLVAPEQLAAAAELVRSMGYVSPRDHVEDGLPSLHFRLLHEQAGLPPIELHWRIHWYERMFAQQRLLAPLGANGADDATWRPAPADELAALLLFYARDGFVGLRLAADIGAWWDAVGGQLPPGKLGEICDTYPALRRPLLAATYAAGRVVGLPTTQLLGATPARRVRERLAARMANPLPRSSRPQLYAEIGFVDWLLAPPGGLRAVFRRQVMIPRGVRLERARCAGAPRAASAWGYAARVLGRYPFALARLVGRRGAGANDLLPRRSGLSVSCWRG